jgi:hypothetical protein
MRGVVVFFYGSEQHVGWFKRMSDCADFKLSQYGESTKKRYWGLTGKFACAHAMSAQMCACPEH